MNGLLLFYIQFNLLLVLGYLLWLMSTKFVAAVSVENSHQLELKLARTFLLLLLFAGFIYPLLTMFSSNLFPLFTKSSLGLGTEINSFVDSANYVLYSAPTDIQETALFRSIGLADILLLGFLVQLYRYGMNLFRLYHVVSKATPWRKAGRCELLFSDQVSTPFSTIAFFKKQVVLPVSLLNSSTNLRIALRHEVQHHRAGDLYWVLLTDILKLVCYLNPAAYFWKNQIECLQEYACDEQLLRKQKFSAEEYVQCLLDVATNNSGNTLVACSNMAIGLSVFTNEKSQLKRRVTMISKIKVRQETVFKTIWQMCFMGLMAVGASFFVYAQEESSDVEKINQDYIKQWFYKIDEGEAKVKAIDDRRAEIGDEQFRREQVEERIIMDEEYPERKQYVEQQTKQLEAMEISEQVEFLQAQAERLLAQRDNVLGIDAEQELLNVARKQGESPDAYASRLVNLYMGELRAGKGLEQYATGMEQAWEELYDSNQSLEARIDALEQENIELRKQN